MAQRGKKKNKADNIVDKNLSQQSKVCSNN